MFNIFQKQDHHSWWVNVTKYMITVSIAFKPNLRDQKDRTEREIV